MARIRSLGTRAWLVPALVVLAIYPLVVRTQYYQHLLFLTLLYATTASAWNIIGGYAGYTSLGHSVFFGLGAYFIALTSRNFGWNPFVVAPLAGLFCALVGAVIGWIALRTRGSAFIVVTIALVWITILIAVNWKSLTHGTHGLNLPIPPYPVSIIKIPFYYAALVLLAFTVWTSWRIKISKFGMGLVAIREDEDKAEAVGVSTTFYKVLAFCISVFFVGIAGGLYAYYLTYISPEYVFNIVFGAQMILMTVLGGKGTLWGPVLGAFITQPLSDLILFRFGESQIHIAIYGVSLLLVIIYLPYGILPTLAPRIAKFGRDRAKRKAARESSAGAAGVSDSVVEEVGKNV